MLTWILVYTVEICDLPKSQRKGVKSFDYNLFFNENVEDSTSSDEEDEDIPEPDIPIEDLIMDLPDLPPMYAKKK